MKLGLIATGVGAAVGVLGKMLKLATESSGHFAATAKLWDTGMRMVFRPMGDTIGLILRPFALMMIKWAVPFYQKFAENIPTIQEGGEKIQEGKVAEGLGDIGGSWLDILFGEGAGDKLRSNTDAWQIFYDTVFKGASDFWGSYTRGGDAFWKGVSNWLDKIFESKMAYADTGETVSETNKEMDSFTQWLKAITEEVKKRTTLEGLGIEPGSDFTEIGANKTRTDKKHFGENKLLSRGAYDFLIRHRGQEGANQFLEERGYTGISSGQSGVGGGGKMSHGQGGTEISVYINKATMEDPNLGNKIQDAVQKEMKKIPGRRY